ncbi:MAG: YdcF family protein [Lachnospiraceae bacterium]|nr:YdcF family protein [Lachnospiraceae bacterium]
MRIMVPVFLGIICVLYGFFVLGAASGSSFWLIWPLLGAGFFVMAGLFYTRFFETHRGPALVLGLLAAAAVLALFLLNGVILRQFRAQGEKGLDYIIVLGAQVREGGPSAILKYRLDEAAAYLSENENTLCILSGGRGGNEPFPEAEGMYAYLVSCGIDEGRLIKEDRSRNTTENIANSRELMREGYQNVGIVTNNFHAARALLLAKAAGLTNPCALAADSNVLYLPNNMLRECLALVKDKLAGNLG